MHDLNFSFFLVFNLPHPLPPPSPNKGKFWLLSVIFSSLVRSYSDSSPIWRLWRRKIQIYRVRDTIDTHVVTRRKWESMLIMKKLFTFYTLTLLHVSNYILHILLYKFPLALRRRIHWTIKASLVGNFFLILMILMISCWVGLTNSEVFSLNSLKEFLPKEYVKSKNIEKKIKEVSISGHL